LVHVHQDVEWRVDPSEYVSDERAISGIAQPRNLIV